MFKARRVGRLGSIEVAIKKASALLQRLVKPSGPTWARTRDHLIMSQVL